MICLHKLDVLEFSNKKKFRLNKCNLTSCWLEIFLEHKEEYVLKEMRH